MNIMYNNLARVFFHVIRAHEDVHLHQIKKNNTGNRNSSLADAIKTIRTSQLK